MTKLERLIKELCPNGVKNNALWELTIWDKKFNSVDKFKQKEICKYNYLLAAQLKEFESENGQVKILTTSETDLWAQEEDVTSILSEGEIVCIPWGGNPIVQYYNGKFITGDNRIARVLDTKKLNCKYLYYSLQNRLKEIASFYRGAGIMHPDMSKVLDLSIPVPPLLVQEEIVRVLDELTEKTDNLMLELNAELEERKKQYEYFQNELFANCEDMEYVDVPLGDVILSLKTGLNPRKNFKLNTPDSCCPYITGKDIFNNKVNVTARTDEITMDAVALINKRACIETDDLLFASTGTGTVGRMAIVEDYKGDWSISESIYAIKVNKDVVLPKFLMYLLYTENVISQYKTKITKASVPHLKVADLLKVKISIPSIQEQKRIIKAAETFTATQDLLISNLMHEIENRKKQYEFYRDKLLTFKCI